MADKNLDARGQGEYLYDYKNDIMVFKVKNREYSHSLDFENLIVDIDAEGYITGLRIIDASTIFKLSKIALNSVKGFEFNSQTEDKIINIQLRFMAVLRNKPIVKQGQDFVREALNSNITDSKVVCTVS